MALKDNIRNKKNFEKKKKIFEDYQREKGCYFCNENEPACLDFHHKDPSEKKFNISHYCKRFPIERTFKEIEKCVVVCANCHAKVHAGVLTLAI